MSENKIEHYLIVDGLLNGTGIRSEYKGGYIDPLSLGLSESLIKRLSIWLKKYEEIHYEGYKDEDAVKILDSEGIEIAKAIKAELKDSKVSYFSDACLITYQIE